MRIAAQFICYISSLLALLVLSLLFDTSLFQAKFYANDLLNGKPLPLISEFFIAHHHLPTYLSLLPWLCLIGAPLLTATGSRNYWNPEKFALRYLAFISSEILLFVVLLAALVLPFHGALKIWPEPELDSLESRVQLIFWCAAGVIAVAGVYRVVQVCQRRGA